MDGGAVIAMPLTQARIRQACDRHFRAQGLGGKGLGLRGGYGLEGKTLLRACELIEEELGLTIPVATMIEWAFEDAPLVDVVTDIYRELPAERRADG